MLFLWTESEAWQIRLIERGGVLTGVELSGIDCKRKAQIFGEDCNQQVEISRFTPTCTSPICKTSPIAHAASANDFNSEQTAHSELVSC